MAILLGGWLVKFAECRNISSLASLLLLCHSDLVDDEETLEYFSEDCQLILIDSIVTHKLYPVMAELLQ